MAPNYQDYIEQVVALKKQGFNNHLISKSILKTSTFVSAVLKQATINGHTFPKLSTSSNKNKRRDMVISPESAAKKPLPKVTGIFKKNQVVEEIAGEPEIENLPIKGNPGLNTPKDFWLFQ